MSSNFETWVIVYRSKGLAKVIAYGVFPAWGVRERKILSIYVILKFVSALLSIAPASNKICTFFAGSVTVSLCM